MTTLPHIKHLRINGRMLEYATTTGRLLTHLEIDYQPIEKVHAFGSGIFYAQDEASGYANLMSASTPLMFMLGEGGRGQVD